MFQIIDGDDDVSCSDNKAECGSTNLGLVLR